MRRHASAACAEGAHKVIATQCRFARQFVQCQILQRSARQSVRAHPRQLSVHLLPARLLRNAIASGVAKRGKHWQGILMADKSVYSVTPDTKLSLRHSLSDRAGV